MVCIKKLLTKNKVTVISLIVYYKGRNTVVFKVLVPVIYTIPDKFVCLDYLGFHQDKLSKHEKYLATNYLVIFLGLEYLMF